MNSPLQQFAQKCDRQYIFDKKAYVQNQNCTLAQKVYTNSACNAHGNFQIYQSVTSLARYVTDWYLIIYFTYQRHLSNIYMDIYIIRCDKQYEKNSINSLCRSKLTGYIYNIYIYQVSPVTCQMSLTPKATVMYHPPANSPSRNSRMQLLILT